MKKMISLTINIAIALCFVTLSIPKLNVIATTKPYTLFSSCDTNWTHYELEISNFKEGGGSVGITLAPNQIRPLQTGNGADKFMQITSENIGLSDTVGGIGMWVWTDSDVVFDSGDIQVSSSENCDNNAYVWNIIQWKTQLSPGWKWLTLKLSDAQKLGNPDPNALNFMRLFIAHKSATSKRFLVDDIRLIDITNEGNLNAPTYGVIPTPTVTPTFTVAPSKAYTQFSSCDTNWTHYELETSNYKNGGGAVGITLAPNQIRPLQTGNAAEKFMQITSKNINLTRSTGGLGLWVWIDKNVLFDIGDIQVSSSGNSDVDAYVWNISQWKNRLNPGWTWLTLKFSDAEKLGNPNLNVLNFMRLFIVHKSTSAKRFLADDIRLLDITVSNNFKEPTYPISNSSPVSSSSSGTNSSQGNSNLNLPDYYKFLNCDSDWGRYKLDSDNKKEGKASVSATIMGNMCYFEAGFSSTDSLDKQNPIPPVNVQYNASSCYVGIWIYYDGKPFINNGVGIIEIGSAGKYDTDSYQFSRQLWENQIDTKKASWNWVVLRLPDAAKVGTPELGGINYFRIYFTKANDEQLIINLDDIRIINGDNANNLKSPTYPSTNDKFVGTGDYYISKEGNSEASVLSPINDLILENIAPYQGYILSKYNSPTFTTLVFGILSIINILIATTLLILYRRKNKNLYMGNKE